MQRDRKVLLGLHTLPRKMVNSQGVSTDFQHAIENFQNKIATKPHIFPDAMLSDRKQS